MDPNRQHTFIANSDERPREYYFNRGLDDISSHSQYFPQERTSSNKKVCGCNNISGNVMCNGCQTNTPEEHWNLEGTDFRNPDPRVIMGQNQVYIHSNMSNRTYWQQSNSKFPKESLIPSKSSVGLPSIDRNVSNKNCTLETNYNFKQSQPQQCINSISVYCKDRATYEPMVTAKGGYASASSVNPMYNLDVHHSTTNVEGLRNSKSDQHIINPSNIIAPKEQHPSPNYARKCPQIFAPEEQNTAHLNLYMSAPPQFSSDKFTNIHARTTTPAQQQNYSPLGSTASSSSHPHPHILPETSKFRESPLHMSSTISTYSTPQRKHSNPMIHSAQPNIIQKQQSTYANNNGSMQSRSANYYPQVDTKIQSNTSASSSSEMSPIIMKQTHTHYQYSKSPTIPPPSSQSLVGTKTTSTREIIVDYVKKEDDSYDSHGVPNRNLYANPYNTPPSSDSCCKGSSSPYGIPSNYRETITTNKINLLNQNTPPPSRTSRHRDQIFYYEAQHPTYDGNSHCLTSPVVATVASPSPSMSTSQMQIHHSDYASQIHHTQTYHQHQHQLQLQHQHQADAYRPSSIQTQEMPPNHSDTYKRQIHKSLTNPSNANVKRVQAFGVQSVLPPQTLPASKKTHMPKPNYRELINKEYAKRNATTEQELNLQIIKKTLNVDTQVIRTMSECVVESGSTQATLPVDGIQQNPAIMTATDKIPHIISSVQNTPNRGEVYKPKLDRINPTSQALILPNIKQEEKLNPFPLDLSMRTVKTKADSTDYKYGRTQANCQMPEYKYSLPRVDFTPNFSLHTTERSIITKMHMPNSNKMNQSEIVVCNKASDSSHIPSVSPASVKSNQSSQPTRKNILSETCELPSKPFAIQNVSTIPLRNELQTASNTLVIKTATPSVIQCDMESCQMRPTVLETNPYASARLIKSELNLTDKNLIAVEQLPPDTSIMPLPKNNVAATGSPHAVMFERSSIMPTPLSTQSTYGLACEQNPNFLGRKRHLQEYCNSKYNEPVIKQSRCYESTEHIEYSRPACVGVIHEGIKETERMKTAEKSIHAELVGYQENSAIVLNENIPICKKEPLTPTLESAQMSNLPIKTENNSIIAARIRTKAELKGFTFSSPIREKSSTPKEFPKIKEEPLHNSCTEMPSIPELNDNYDQGSLLDFGWNNTCNSFVEQLLSNSKKKLINKIVRNTIKQDLSEDDIPVSTILKDSSAMGCTEDVQKNKISTTDRFVEDNISNMESSASTASVSEVKLMGEHDSTATKLQSSECLSQTQKKISKCDREKNRLQQEKRIAARMQCGSSSETDNELDKRKSERQKKPLKKGKARSNLCSGRSKPSDCGSDTSDSDLGSNVSVLKGDQKSITEKTKHRNSRKEMPTKEEECIVANLEKCDNNSNEKHTQSRDLPTTAAAVSSRTTEKPMIHELKRNGSDCGGTIKESATQKVQCPDNINKANSVKPIKKSKFHSKVDLNTMTRSKRRRELEQQLANSKVLRNEKIIRNSTTKITRKYVRKFAAAQNSSSKESLKEKMSGVMSTRLRSRMNEQVKTKLRKNEFNKKGIRTKLQECKVAPSKTGKERQISDDYLEAYRFKRSLKVPPSLITIKQPSNHKIAASLPDLERDNDEISTFPKHRIKSRKSSSSFLKSNSAFLKSHEASNSSPKEHRSFIDFLHSRVVTNSKCSKSRTKGPRTSGNFDSLNVHSETSQNTESNSVSELLPSLKNTDICDDLNEGKKRHFSIFETKILKTKTRTESKLQQKKEIIREIFVGDDRPASAPPEMIQSADMGETMTYEQKYEQFLHKMNIDFNEEKLGKFGRASNSTIRYITPPAVKIKQEDDTESASAIDADEKLECENQQDSLSIISGTVTTGFRRRRPGKYLRRKGSSGFDYIRKKKKAAHTTNVNNQSSQAIVKVEKQEDDYELKTKTENDVSREIQKWVLNKGVGQSTMHKAARLGYIDVILYCLDRLNMNPDQKDNAGYTPLHEACTNGWLEIARILLQYGANHSEAAHSGIRPLHEASENDHEEIVRLLLSYGADPLLATYSGQTPLMLASSTAMRNILNNHLRDVQNVGPDGKPWHFNGPWEIFDATKCGYDIFGGAPNFTCDMSRALRKSSCSNLIANKKQLNQYGETSSKTVMDECAVVLDNIGRFNSVRLYNDNKPEFLVENSDSEGEIFEFEEADVLLPPLYLLKDEGTEKWVLLNDLCNLLKVKSKDTLLNKIYPCSSVSSAHKSLTRELKMSDFLEKATCLQLLCAGEKINICASKVVLIKYNERVRNLLGVKTILMKF